VDVSVVQAVHQAVVVAVLVELLHVAPDDLRAAEQVVGAVLERSTTLGAVPPQHLLPSVLPVAPGDEEGAAEVAASGGREAADGGVAAGGGLAQAAQTPVVHHRVRGRDQQAHRADEK